MALLSNNNAFQSAWVVADFEAAVQFWAESYGVGPFFSLDWQSPPELLYRGQPGSLEMKVAWGQAGDMQIELIQPVSDGPNVYRDLVPAGETRFHHVCFWSDDMQADKDRLAAAGYECAMDAGPTGGFAYFDTSHVNGHMLELLNRNSPIAGIFERIKSIAADWDGERPLREFGELMG